MPLSAWAFGGMLILVAGVAAGQVVAPALVPDGTETVSPTTAPLSSVAGPPGGHEASAAPTQGPVVPADRAPAVAIEPAAPVRFDSRRLGIDAPVTPVDASAGVLLPPGDPRQLGWWRDGAMPGSGRGRVLITGHTVQAGGGAFDDLSRLRLGDTVDVTTEAGSQRYQVASSRYLTIETFADRAPRLLRSSGPERLVLVTCDGWDGVGYQGSTVVIAEPVAGRQQ